MTEIDYSSLYRLQLLFSELDSLPNPDSEIERRFADDASQNAVKWLYEHRRRGENRESDAPQIDLDSLDLQVETANLYADTKALKMDGATLDPRESLAVNKLQMDLLGKILDLHERSKRHRQIGEFVQSVFEILTEEQKEKIVKAYGGVYHD